MWEIQTVQEKEKSPGTPPSKDSDEHLARKISFFAITPSDSG